MYRIYSKYNNSYFEYNLYFHIVNCIYSIIYNLPNCTIFCTNIVFVLRFLSGDAHVYWSIRKKLLFDQFWMDKFNSDQYNIE